MYCANSPLKVSERRIDSDSDESFILILINLADLVIMVNLVILVVGVMGFQKSMYGEAGTR